MDLDTVFDFLSSQVLQRSAPVGELIDNVGNGGREQDVPRIAKVHHALRDVDACSDDVDLFFDVSVPVDGTRMHAHSYLDAGGTSKGIGNLQRAQDRREWISHENQCQSI